MGMNLKSVCHNCKERIFHFRNKENKTLLPFYKKHSLCMRLDPRHVETLEDQLQWAEWMDNDSEYTEVELDK